MTIFFMEKKLAKLMLGIMTVAPSYNSLGATTTHIETSNLKQKKTPPIPKNSSENNQSGENQIGTSFFQLTTTKTTPIREIGIANEQHQDFAVIYLVLNKLFTNRIFCELRAYSVYRYRTATPPQPPVVTTAIPSSSERNLFGYGGIAIIGYNIDLNDKVSLMPFTRLQALTNTALAYKDTFGNEIQSANYTAYLGGKLSMQVTPVFATYVSYFAGYNKTVLTGHGVYPNAGNPTINGFISVIELGAPYKFNKLWNLTPYLQFITFAPYANKAADTPPYNVKDITTTGSVFAVRLSYVF